MGAPTSNLNHRYRQRHRHPTAGWSDNNPLTLKRLCLLSAASVNTCSIQWNLASVCCSEDLVKRLAFRRLRPPRRTPVQMHTQPGSGPDRRLWRPLCPAPPPDLTQEDRQGTGWQTWYIQSRTHADFMSRAVILSQLTRHTHNLCTKDAGVVLCCFDKTLPSYHDVTFSNIA